MTVSLFALLGSAHIKAACKQVGEIDPWDQYHQHFMSSFYVRRSRKRNNSVKSSVSFMLLGSTSAKVVRKNVDEIDTMLQPFD